MKNISFETLQKVSFVIDTVDDKDTKSVLEDFAKKATRKAIFDYRLSADDTQEILGEINSFGSDFIEETVQLVEAIGQHTGYDKLVGLYSEVDKIKKELLGLQGELRNILSECLTTEEDTASQEATQVASPVTNGGSAVIQGWQGGK